MYTKFISKPIQEKLKAKERALARLGNQPQEQQNDDSLELKDLASRTVFVRMCSNKSKVPNILISGGEHNDRGIPLGFGDSYKDRRGNTDEEGNPIDNSGIRAVPGIKDITIEYKDGFKAISERKCKQWFKNMRNEKGLCSLKVFQASESKNYKNRFYICRNGKICYKLFFSYVPFIYCIIYSYILI